MYVNKEDKKWRIPKKFRVAADLDDEQSKQLLIESKAKQKEWAAKAASPFSASPASVFRHKALLVIESYSNRPLTTLTAHETEELAEAYARIGRYDKAAQRTDNEAFRRLYEQYWAAIFRPDSEWCEHGPIHQYVKDHIYSAKHGKEMPLLACNVCGWLNVDEKPGHILEGEARRATVRKAVKGMSQEEVRDYLNREHPKQS